MKVLHYVAEFSKPSETFIYDLISNLERSVCSNHVLTHVLRLTDERPLEKISLINENVSLPKRIFHNIFRRYQVKNEKATVRKIHDIKPDIIHAHFGPNGIKMGQLLVRNNVKTPLLISMHGTDTTKYPLKNKKYKKIIKMLCQSKRATFVFPSKYLRDEFINNVGVPRSSNLMVIPNSYNPEFKHTKKQYFKHGKTLKIISVGRLVKWKGFQFLIKALYSFNKYYPDWELKIIGDGECRSMLEKKIQKCGLHEKIELLGFISHKKMAGILSSHDVYIQPSIVDSDTHQAESFGVAVMEAIIVGLPVIVTNTGGLPDTVMGGDNEFAKIVSPASPASINEAIIDLMESKTFRDNFPFRNKIEKRYSVDNQLTQFKYLYNTCKKDIRTLD